MKHNVGSFDAAIRTVLAIAIIAIGHQYRTWWAMIGLVPFFTAAFAFCPLYGLFHFDTSGQDEIDDRHPPTHSKMKNV